MNTENIFCYRLLNGQDIIGKFNREQDGKIYLDNALAYVISEGKTDNGQPALSFAFVPLSFASTRNPEEVRYGISIELEKTAICFKYDLAKDYIEAYLQQISIVQKISKPGLIIPG
jgi:hypothetical protein